MTNVKKLTPTQILKTENKGLRDEIWRLRLVNDEQNKRLTLLERLANAPPTVMIACEKIVDAAAHQVSDALQMIKEAKR